MYKDILKRLETWWRLPNDQRTIKAIEPIMVKVLAELDASEPTDDLFICPFCKAHDFDLLGLKLHYENGYCEIYNDTHLPDQQIYKDQSEPPKE